MATIYENGQNFLRAFPVQPASIIQSDAGKKPRDIKTGIDGTSWRCPPDWAVQCSTILAAGVKVTDPLFRCLRELDNELSRDVMGEKSGITIWYSLTGGPSALARELQGAR